MSRSPGPDYPHFNKKKIVVLVVGAMLILLLALLWVMGGP